MVATTALERLQSSLRSVQSAAHSSLLDVEFGAPEVMQARVEWLRQKFNSPDGKSIPDDRILEAIRRYCANSGRGPSSPRETYFLAWGAARVGLDNGGAPFIERRVSFGNFMQQLSEAQSLPPARTWRGLLAAYFSYNAKPGTNGHANWEALREYLRRTLSPLYRAARIPLPWLKTLNENPALLDENAARHFANDVLAGQTALIDAIRADLDIPPSSWFWERLVLSQVEQATRLTDSRFKDLLPILLPQLDRSPSVLDEGVALLLTRYQTCDDSSQHEMLQDFVIDPSRWGNPQLSSHAKWGLVGATVRQMVQEWLALEDLQDFFALLQESRKTDVRRLDYWMRFIRQISFSHIVLGNDAWSNRARDFRELRERKRGRLSELVGSSPSNNAFIMRIGDYFFVEFSETGNACFGYSQKRMPFQIAPRIAVHKLKTKAEQVFRETHMSSWEAKFDLALLSLGIVPDERGARAKKATSRAYDFHEADSSSLRTSTRSASTKTNGVEQIRRIVRLCEEHGLSYFNKLEAGGAFWVYCQDRDTICGRQLEEWGFKYKVGRGYWWQP